MAGLPTDEIPVLKDVEDEDKAPKKKDQKAAEEESSSSSSSDSSSDEGLPTSPGAEKPPTSESGDPVAEVLHPQDAPDDGSTGVLMVETINLYNEPFESTQEIKVSFVGFLKSCPGPLCMFIYLFCIKCFRR